MACGTCCPGSAQVHGSRFLKHRNLAATMGKVVLCGALALLCLAGAALCSESGALDEGKPVPSVDRCGAMPAG